MENKKKMIFNVLFLFLVFAATLYGVFHGEDLSEIAEILKTVNLYWLLPGVACVIIFIWGESIIIFYMMHTLGIHLKKWKCFLFSSVGFFFSCITPSATGGQPAQIYYMKKEKIPIPVSTLNFMNVAELVDDMGGIEQDITEEETKYINGYIDELNGIRGTSSAHITEAGTYTLDGTQAVAFSRIRYTEGGDYKRSERQRTVLFKIFSKAQELDKAKKIDIAKSMLDKINTNYLESEVLRLLSTITEYKVEAMDAFPKVFYSGKIDGVFYEVPVTLNDMSTQMHTFLYPTETYTPSETVQSISAQESAVAPTANNDFTQQ